jgi:predicted  nucleic acid-binding Zn-ribbon protein
MSEHDNNMAEIMSLVLDEMRGMRREFREGISELKHEQQNTNERLGHLEEQQTVANQRLEAIEYALSHDGREFRSRIERLESRVLKIEERV